MAAHEGTILRLPSRPPARTNSPATRGNDFLSRRTKRPVDRRNCGATLTRATTDAFETNAGQPHRLHEPLSHPHQVTGMRFSYKPDLLAIRQLQAIARRQRYVHLELDSAAIHHGRDDDISLLQTSYGTRQNISRTQSLRLFRGQ